MDHFFYPSNAHHGNVNNAHNSDINFTPLFRLLDDFGRYSSGSGAARPGARAALPTFQPKFDVRETKTAYELHGEMPGAKRENIHIEFTEPQVLQVRGRIERSHAATNDAAAFKALTEGGEVAADDSASDAGAATAGSDDNKTTTGRSSPQPHKATVQDEAEAEAEEKGTGAAVNTPATSVAAPVSHHIQQQQHKKTPDFKYWVTERSIGEFSRTFNLPTRVDQGAVTASLKDGILTVVIPKSKKHEARRIVVG
jgi:HSP20 family molecular chaperone IbpA